MNVLILVVHQTPHVHPQQPVQWQNTNPSVCVHLVSMVTPSFSVLCWVAAPMTSALLVMLVSTSSARILVKEMCVVWEPSVLQGHIIILVLASLATVGIRTWLAVNLKPKCVWWIMTVVLGWCVLVVCALIPVSKKDHVHPMPFALSKTLDLSSP